jgi:mono/diheme cytochrome c family protein
MRPIPQWRGGLPLVIPSKFAQLAAALIGAVVLGIASPSALAAADSKDPAIAEYQAVVSPILEKHCYECHGDGFDKGKVAFDALDTDEKLLKPDRAGSQRPRAGLCRRKKTSTLCREQKLERWMVACSRSIRKSRSGRVTVRGSIAWNTQYGTTC